MTLTLHIRQIDTAGADTGRPVEALSFTGSWEEANVYQRGDILDNLPSCPGRVFAIQQRRWVGKDLVLSVHERVS